MPAERLQKIIAAAGIASRRKAEELISAGHVKVNGTVVTALGTKADPDTDHIRVDGKLLQGAQHHVYLLSKSSTLNFKTLILGLLYRTQPYGFAR